MSAKDNIISRGRLLVNLVLERNNVPVPDKLPEETEVRKIETEKEMQQSMEFSAEKTSDLKENCEQECEMDAASLPATPAHILNAIENSNLQETSSRNKRKRLQWKAEKTERETKCKLIRLENISSSSSEVDDSDRDPNYSSDSSSDSDTSSSTTSDLHESQNINNENATAQVEGTAQRKGKKRVAMPLEWKKNKVKLLRNAGKSYSSLSKTKKFIAARALREPCGETCRIKCSSKINEGNRQQIFEKYWSLKDITRQRDFISKSMQQINPTYRYTKSENGRRLNHAFFFRNK